MLRSFKTGPQVSYIGKTFVMCKARTSQKVTHPEISHAQTHLATKIFHIS